MYFNYFMSYESYSLNECMNDKGHREYLLLKVHFSPLEHEKMTQDKENAHAILARPLNNVFSSLDN